MFARALFFCMSFILAGFAPLHATTINIEKEPTELTNLRQAHEAEVSRTLQPVEARFRQDLDTVEKLSVSRPELKQAIVAEYESERKATLQKLNEKYARELDALEKMLIQKRDLKGALVVQVERKKAMEGGANPAAVAPAPAPAAAVKKSGPFTYSSEAEGRAGAPGFSENNVYTFTMNEVRSKTKLTIYASGRGSTNTYGEIFLVTPTGRERVHKWSPGDFDETARDVTSYKKLKPIVLMVSELVTKPGIYKVDFQYDKGIDPLIIKYVELITW